MNSQKRFKLTRQAMFLATISAAFPVVGYCSAGRVDFAVGNVESVTSSGARHSIAKGAEINAGETISTAAGARAQVRFTDGGFISLQPNTQFRVDEFNYRNKTDGGERSFFSLLKGGFRAVTGVIGHLNKNTYRVKTSAATIGIRGTGYNVESRDGATFVNVGEGAVFLSNSAGSLTITAGGAAFVANLNTPPVPTHEQPKTPPAALQEPEFSIADKRDSSGNVTILPVMPSGPGYTLAYTYTDGSSVFGATSTPSVTATFNNGGLLTATGGVAVPSTVVATTSANDGIIGWGRWTGSTSGSGLPTLSSTGVFDYVIGIPTAVLPTGPATYSLLGYTSPTDSNGATGYTVSSGTLTATFAGTGSTVAVNMNVGNASNTYNINNTASPFTFTGSTFGGTASTTCSGVGMCSSVSASVNGFFAGANASRAGLSYSIVNYGATPVHNIQGVATFTKN